MSVFTGSVQIGEAGIPFDEIRTVTAAGRNRGGRRKADRGIGDDSLCGGNVRGADKKGGRMGIPNKRLGRKHKMSFWPSV